MAFTDDEKASLRYYLGRADYNLPQPCNGWESLNTALTLLTPEGEEKVRELLVKLELVEAKLCEVDCLKIAEVHQGVKFWDPRKIRGILHQEGRRIVRAIADFLHITVIRTPFDVRRSTLTRRG